MPDQRQKFASLSDLRNFVHTTLCERENLLAEQFVTRDQPLYMRGEICAYQFILKGPRAIKLGAIWSVQQGTILFYDTRGERFLKALVDQGTALLTQPLAG